jgi:CheY-like chemotaxis protein
VNVLVVDDSEAIGKMVVQVLERAGYEARWVRTGAAALAAAKERTPQVVLLDLNLEDAKGLDVARKLRQYPATRKSRLIGLSGDPLPPGKRHRLDGFLLKPVSFPTLLEAVRG